jgi:hypothetical protein
LGAFFVSIPRSFIRNVVYLRPRFRPNRKLLNYLYTCILQKKKLTPRMRCSKSK